VEKASIYIVTYDISDPKRLRRVFRLLKGYGEWVQLSVFQCRLTPVRRIRLESELKSEILRDEDHVLIFRLGTANLKMHDITSLGRVFTAIVHEPIII
jgi:CRISPR-associated protein Cas2